MYSSLTRTERPFIRSSPTALALAMLLAICSLTAAWASAVAVPGTDFYVFWLTPQLVRSAATSNVYSRPERERFSQEFLQRAARSGTERQLQSARIRGTVDPTGTPFLYAAIGSLLTGDYDVDLAIYQTLSVALFAAAVVVLCLLLGYPLYGALLALVLFTGFFWPFEWDQMVANTNRIQVALLALLLVAGRVARSDPRYLLVGAVLGVTLAFKPNLVYVAFSFWLVALVNLRYRKLLLSGAGALAGGLLATTMSSLYFRSSRAWLDWLGVMGEVLEFDLATGNFAISRVLLETFGVSLLVPLTVAACVMLAGAAWLGRRRFRSEADADGPREAHEDFLAVALGSACAVLAAPLAWPHYFLLIAPMAVFAIRPVDRFFEVTPGSPELRRALAAIAILLLSGVPLRSLGVDEPATLALVYFLGVAILFGLGALELASLDRRRPAIGAHEQEGALPAVG